MSRFQRHASASLQTIQRVIRLPFGAMHPPSKRGSSSLRGRSTALRGAWLAAFLLPFILLGGCSGDSGDDDDDPSPTPIPDPDRNPPEIVLEEVDEDQPIGTEVTVTAQLSDVSGIYVASLYYRSAGTDFWGSAFMVQGGDGLWSATIPGAYVQAAGVDYYVKATDASLNRNTAYAPAEGPTGPKHFSTGIVDQPFPYVATFDPPEDSPPGTAWSLEDTGWTLFIEGFDNQRNWELTNFTSHSGELAALHGNGSAQQLDDFFDYLVSPPIDLSEATLIDLYWWERVDDPEEAEHTLLISTGSPDPQAGDFEPVLDPLPPSEGADKAWVRSRHVDLSAWAGEPRVYLAFTYAGKFGDEWYIDDVTVTVPEPDVVFGTPSLEPDPVDPGDTSVVTFPFQNIGLIETGALTATLEGESLLAIAPSSLTVSSVEAGQAGIAGPFTVTVDPAFPANRYAPLTLTLTDGARTWTQTTRLQVGNPAYAHIEITHAFADDIQLYLGYGDPEDPTEELLVQADEGGDAAGTFSWDVDISGYIDAIPPDAGSSRWYVRVWDDSPGNSGTLDVFRIVQDETTWDSGGLPRPIPDDTRSLYAFIPGMADFAIRSTTTLPEVVQPGETVLLSLSLSNLAAPPAGPLTGTLTALDPDVSGLSSDPVTFTYTTPETPEGGIFGTATQETPFQFEVSAAHTDSSPLRFKLELTDGLDGWTLPVEVAVPYPVLAGLGVTIEDTGSSTGVDDALNPGEKTTLRLRLRNDGDQATFGDVTATVAVIDDGGTGATVSPTPVKLLKDASSAVLLAGEGGTNTVPIQLTGGSTGDRIDLEITLSDGVLTVVEPRTLTVGYVPWNPIIPVDDPQGDSLASPDLARGMFLRQGNLLKLRWTTWDNLDVDQTSLYAFISALPGYQYALVYAYGQAQVAQWTTSAEGGYWYRRYPTPSSLYAVEINSREVELGIDLAELSLVGTPLYGGASVGICDGTLACDYAPDDASDGTGVTRFWW